MRLALLLLLVFCGPVVLAAEEQSTYLTVNQEKVFVRFKKADAGFPTFVLLNGLTYSTSQWAAFASALEKIEPRAGILRYDMRGMGKTLLAGPLPVNYSISLESQVEQLKGILGQLKIKKPQLVGLSYGGGVALAFATAHPGNTGSLFLLAPFTEALAAQDRLIRAQVSGTRLTFPLNPASDDELYDYYLRQFVYSNYPTNEPSVLENPFKLEAIFRMVQGIRSFRAEEIAKDLPAKSVHLIVAKQDQYIPREVMDHFWDSIPARAKMSRIDISYSEHKLPEAIPAYSAAWVFTAWKESLRGEFQGESWAFRAKGDSQVIELPRP